MTDEEIEKEAEDFLKKSLKVDDDEFDFFKSPMQKKLLKSWCMNFIIFANYIILQPTMNV